MTNLLSIDELLIMHEKNLKEIRTLETRNRLLLKAAVFRVVMENRTKEGITFKEIMDKLPHVPAIDTWEALIASKKTGDIIESKFDHYRAILGEHQ